MHHSFRLQLATNTLTADAKRIGVTEAQLQAIHINVHATITQVTEPILWLTYHIKLPNPTLAAQLQWSEWQAHQVNFTDYLWQKTCLECFISGSKTTQYVEINANPNGQYAIYQFSAYRSPSSLPPIPLRQPNSQHLARVHWATDADYQNQHQDEKQSANKMDDKPSLEHTRRFGMALEPQIQAMPVEDLQLHPCVILYFGTVALYFAPAHASPPDFHQRHYWCTFTPN